jgi:SWI/SNF-related matrix-associated actin-dependent regulator 1 of chromatin subfamily A
MINLDDIRGRSALDLLKNYSGINPYIIKLKQDLLKNNKIKLTDNQTKYVADNHDKEPIFINRVVRITSYLGEELKRVDELSFTPEKILIEFILAETNKTFHIYGKLTKKQKESRLYWIPKTQVIDDPYFENLDVNVDFEKYNTILEKYGKKLYKHQEDGIKFLLSRNGCILADDMGLGKTIQTIIAALETGLERILIVCPTSAKINWQREINIFCDKTAIVEGKRWKKSKFTIINFDILKNFHTLVDGRKINTYEGEMNRELANANFDLIIVDEAHNLKNANSIRGKILLELATKYNVSKTWLLTGTPVANRPMDFFNLLRIIKSPITDNWQHFATRYCDAKKMFKTLKNGKKKKIWITDGASNLEELSQRTKNILLRRLKNDVLDMPDKIITPMYYQLDGSSNIEYNQLWDDYLTKREIEGKGEIDLQKELVELILLRKFIAEKAIPYTIELVENAIEMDKKVIVFTSFNDELNMLSEHFGKLAVCHNGSMTTKEKQASVDSFQNNPKVKVFIGNIKSAGVAITLTEATVVVFNSFDWVPGNNEQAEDRCVFAGQLIMTDKGFRKIEDIHVGDTVYTHLGNFKTVLATHSHLEKTKARIDITSIGYNKTLSLTEDHKLYIYDKELNLFYWVRAKFLDINKHLLTLKNNKELFEIDGYNSILQDSEPILKNDYLLYPILSLHVSKPKKGEELVYDLSVEDDHSFVVGNYNVHNCYRIGQKNNVNIYYQIFEDTISITMWDVLKNKKDVISTIIGDKNITDEEISKTIIDNIINNKL